MTAQEDDQWATGAFGTGINVIMIFAGVATAYLAVNLAINLLIPAVGRKYIP